MQKRILILLIMLTCAICSSLVFAETLTVGYLTGGASPFGAVGVREGLFKKEGLDVKLVPF
jgi:ABC-type nitrate/sulfonate/bicarbonate transport system substrate-binding protein